MKVRVFNGLLCCGLILVAAAAQDRGSASGAPGEAQLASLERNGSRDASFVHDPSTIVRCKDEYWLFSTGTGIHSWRSKDLLEWKRGPAVLPAVPTWVTNVVADHRGHFWAPDVIFQDGRYLLYYSVSRFGVNTSAIALLSNPTLDPDEPNYKWTDHGIVVQSYRTNNFNAIDPHVVRTEKGELWMSFGSFWNGIQLLQLNPKSGLRIAPNAPWHRLAYDREIEAPAIHFRDGYYYLFVNWGRCCRGTNSTYNVRVGRSREITGPYVDKEGVDLANNGGTLVLASDDAFIGPGHAGIFEANGRNLFSCHFYDGTRRGRATLAIRPLHWGADGWPHLPPVEPGDKPKVD